MILSPLFAVLLSAVSIAAAPASSPPQIPWSASTLPPPPPPRSLLSLSLSLSAPHLAQSLDRLEPSILTDHLETRIVQLPLKHLSRLDQHVQEWHHLARKVSIQPPDLAARRVSLDITEGDKALLTLAGLRFVDVTDDDDDDDDDDAPPPAFVGPGYPTSLSHNSTSLAPLFATVSTESMRAFLSTFTDFYTRYYRSQTGRDSQRFLVDHLEQLHRDLDPAANVTFREFEHEWNQRTVIVRWEPSAHVSEPEVVILSAHQDSTNSLPFLRAPGADDDGSGTVTLVETFKQLLRHRYRPVDRAVELIFFSAEEGGLLGSGQVAREYAKNKVKVKALFHMDVVAYVKAGTEPVIGMITDGVSPELVEFMKLLVDEYAEIPYAETQCGYGCSDFASFTRSGFRTACLAEGKFEDSNPNMHSTRDTTALAEFSFDHVAQFVRVAIGYAVELGGFEKREKEDKGRSGRWRID
ncbi:hypothetical protein JCM10212_005833 [Sporobolomyces blumeae]